MKSQSPHLLDLLGLEPNALLALVTDHFAARGEPAYRARQVVRWIFEGDARSISDMTDLPAEERRSLGLQFDLAEPKVETISRSKDGTAKHLWKLSDGELVESVLIPSGTRLTLCISSQAGCAMGCTFCATGWTGFGRQLSAGEIVAQFRASRRWAAEHDYAPISNIVYMGMGEPLANAEAVNTSLSILNHGYGVGARKITVSTVGVVPGILALAARPEQFGLAVSLHAPNTELRRKIIPLEKRYPLPELMKALGAFNDAGGKRITFEYTMIDGINDDPALASELAALARPLQAFVNLIPYNPIPYQKWKTSPGHRIEAFREALEAGGVAAAVRVPRGRDIDAACGQLRASALGEDAASRPRAQL